MFSLLFFGNKMEKLKVSPHLHLLSTCNCHTIFHYVQYTFCSIQEYALSKLYAHLCRRYRQMNVFVCKRYTIHETEKMLTHNIPICFSKIRTIIQLQCIQMVQLYGDSIMLETSHPTVGMTTQKHDSLQTLIIYPILIPQEP